MYCIRVTTNWQMFKGGTEEWKAREGDMGSGTNPGVLCTMEACFVACFTRTAVLFNYALYECNKEVTASSLQRSIYPSVVTQYFT
jgi:hypothetical protein